jgi:hypothetical protein
MPQEVRIWQIEDGHPRDLPITKLELESRLEDWLCHDIGMIDSMLLVIGKQVATDFGGIIDLLCLDPDGNTAIVELKRDKTPREIVAQALDYASWVVDLPNERIAQIAAEFLGDTSLERAFEQRFGEPLPDTLNESHKIIVVAAAIDASSERIVRYLSDTHGVNINAVTFQFFRTASGSELLSRVFLVTPSEVDHRSQTRAGRKRKPNRSLNEFLHAADEKGTGAELRAVIAALKPVFGSVRTTLTTVNFVGQWSQDKSGAILNLLPEESTPESGLRFQVYTRRLALLTNTSDNAFAEVFPAGGTFWSYDGKGDPEWEGFTGFLRATDATRLADFMQQATRGRQPT